MNRQGRLNRMALNERRPAASRPAAAGPVPLPPWRDASGRALEAHDQARFGSAFGFDFSAIRIHDDAPTQAGLKAAGARAVTLGTHIGFAADAHTAAHADGGRLLAHELTHSLQQRGAPARSPLSTLRGAEAEAHAAAGRAGAGQAVPSPSVRLPVQPQFDLEDPNRLATVHSNVFPAATTPAGTTTGGSTASAKPWQPATAPGGGTAALIKSEVRAFIKQLEKDDPDQLGEPPVRTDDTDVDREVLVANQRLRKHFTQITATVSDADLQKAADVLGKKETDDPVFQHEWLWNALPRMSSIQDFAIHFADPDAVALRTDLLSHSHLGPRLLTMSRRVAGVHIGIGLQHSIRVNRGVTSKQLMKVLIHELTHMFADAAYTRWVATTANDDLYNEGLTEWLARQVMTADERALPTPYTPRVKRVEAEIVPHVSADDIALAFFQGQVWRLENRSAVAGEQFAAASGIAVGAATKDESAQSRSGPGLTQEVRPDAHYRFLNLGHDSVEPKPEHTDFFRRLKTRLLDPQPTVAVKFIGHASTPGTDAHNQRLSLRRAQAFYRMARNEGVDAARLPDARAPEHHGEREPTLQEEDAQTRAFNRRVEMLLGGAPAAAAPTGSAAGGADKDEP